MDTENNQKENKESTMGGNVEPMQINVPDTLYVIYTDSAFVHKNKYGIVLDFAQTMGPTNRQNVVARIGMSKEHAIALLEVLKKNLEDK
ncbi:hypothetical protein COV24_02895 [candidate division WWE3 bacterium CG10_big_fil_rev_8_21_14_0_10_32_10]|uniref:DUF3467 domain-containing protein n=1 Tax=candidate division WWE3 bacterium CG10_big_fil_rev_8_21_14_0_10_32_10 TaxID=1975090 RepID=A0A2H0RA16_UNCKA|nr:MAG: hypothetical protein COV24_02895 [candidate division WWE3 bacterium CG10_big_fil_rev_8_21_14_0_10_32_10]